MLCYIRKSILQGKHFFLHSPYIFPFLRIRKKRLLANRTSSHKVSDFPSDYPPFTPEHYDRKPDGSRWEAEDILSHGGSCVVGPLGTFVSQPVWDKEEILLATLEMSDIVEARVSFNARLFEIVLWTNRDSLSVVGL
jgi:hypothetical protein